RRHQGAGAVHGDAAPPSQERAAPGRRRRRRGGCTRPHHGRAPPVARPALRPTDVISQIAGRLAVRELDRVELLTSGGVGYEIFIPLGVYETLPALGEEASLFTHLVVRDDAWLLFGF